MPTRPARRDYDPADPRQLLVRERNASQASIPALFQQPPTQNIAKTLGLLMDFFQHEVFVTTSFSFLEIPFDLMNGAVYVPLIEMKHPVPVGREDRAITVV